MDLDILTRLTRECRVFPVPPGAQLAGLRLHSFGANRIDPPAGQDLHRTGNVLHHLTWIAAGEALVREPGPQRLAGVGDILVLPAGTTHRYHSTAVRGWRALFVSFACVEFERLDLRPGVVRPSPAAVRAFATLAAMCAAGSRGPRLAVGLAGVLAELADSTPLRRSEIAADRVAALVRADPLRAWDLQAQAAACGVSWSAMRQALRRRTGFSPERLLRNARLEAGAQALTAGSSVTAAALAAGFADPFHFSRLFRRAYGVPPRHWRDIGG